MRLVGQPEGGGDGVLAKVNETKGVVPGTAQEQMALCDKKEREREREKGDDLTRCNHMAAAAMRRGNATDKKGKKTIFCTLQVIKQWDAIKGLSDYASYTYTTLSTADSSIKGIFDVTQPHSILARIVAQCGKHVLCYTHLRTRK